MERIDEIAVVGSTINPNANIIAHIMNWKGVNVSEIQSLTSRVQDLERILSMDGHLTDTSSFTSSNRGGVSMTNSFGMVRFATPPKAIITVGPKPIK